MQAAPAVLQVVAAAEAARKEVLPVVGRPAAPLVAAEPAEEA